MISAGYRSWLRALAQPATYLGCAMIALVWLSIGFHLAIERENAQKAARQNTGNLARAVEEHLTRSLSDVDRLLLVVRKNYESNPAAFSFSNWTTMTELSQNPANLAGVLNAKGFLTHSSSGPVPTPVDVSDKEHFRFHAGNPNDDIFIAKPFIGRVLGKWSVQLSRRIRNADQSFGGVIGIGFDPYYFVRFYESIDVGPQGFIAMVGLDGVVRAVGGHTFDVMGQVIADPDFFSRQRTSPAGTYFSGSTWGDGVRRLISYRTVKGFPLIIMVGMAESEIVAGADYKQRSYYMVAGLITLLILFGMGSSVSDRVQLERTRDASKTQNVWFEAALNHMSQGLAMFDDKNRLLVTNRQFAELYRLPPEQLKPGMSLREVLEARRARGTFTDPDIDEYIRTRLTRSTEVQEINDHFTVLVRRQRMSGGGVVTTHEDITERRRHEEHISHLAHHDALTGVANRALLCERLDEALKRLQRNGEEFALLLIDLDHFKEVNDTLGHPIGDRLLQAVAQRLQGCIRQTDILARIGGDEFAILQTMLTDRDDATVLARRIRRMVGDYCYLNGAELTPKLSIGIAQAPHDGADAETLFKNADVALYQAKSSGRNRFCFYAAVDVQNSRLPQLRDVHTPRVA
jgi:diguanylate cyclase (GGDEF)-like protein